MAGSNASVGARKRARESRIKLDADRVARDERIETAAAEFFTADEELTQAVERLDRAKARAVTKLSGEGENVERIAALIGVADGEVRRLVKLGQVKRADRTSSDTPATATATTTVSGAVSAESDAA